MAIQARTQRAAFEGELLPPPPKPAIIGPRPTLWEQGVRSVQEARVQLVQRKKRLRTTNGLSIFYRGLAAMFQAGVRIDKGLEILSRQSEEPALAEVLPIVVAKIHGGQSLSKSMGLFPWVFPAMHVRLIEVAEATGKLYKILCQIAEYEEKRTSLLMRVRSALAYPAFLFVFSMVIVVLGPPYMFSGLLKFIVESKGEIPFMTRCLLLFSNFVTSGWFFLFLAVLGGLALRVKYHLAENLDARRNLLRRLMRIPALGKALRIIAVTRFARSLAVTLAAGISPLHGLRLAAEASDNLVLLQAIDRAIDGLHNGMSLHESLHATQFFPMAFVQITMVGEASGLVGESIKRMADLYEVEMDENISQVVSMMEPIWMLMMGLVIGFIAVATMLPIMSLIQHL